MNTVIIETSSMPGMEGPIILTNACCENAHGTPELLAEYGLPGGNYDGDFYPLTAAESQFIGEDLVEVYEGFEAMTGYSVLYEGRKFLAPTVRILLRGRRLYIGAGSARRMRHITPLPVRTRWRLRGARTCS